MVMTTHFSFFNIELLLLPCFLWLIYFVMDDNCWYRLNYSLYVFILMLVGMAFRLDFILRIIPVLLWSLIRDLRQRRLGLPWYPLFTILGVAAAFSFCYGYWDSFHEIAKNFAERVLYAFQNNAVALENLKDSRAVIKELTVFAAFQWTPLFIPFLISGFCALRKKKVFLPVVLAIAGCLIPWAFKREYHYSYSLVAMPLWALVAAEGISALWQKKLYRWIAFSALFGMIFFLISMPFAAGLEVSKEESTRSLYKTKQGSFAIVKNIFLETYYVEFLDMGEKQIEKIVTEVKQADPWSKSKRYCVSDRWRHLDNAELFAFFNRTVEPVQNNCYTSYSFENIQKCDVVVDVVEDAPQAFLDRMNELNEKSAVPFELVYESPVRVMELLEVPEDEGYPDPEKWWNWAKHNVRYHDVFQTKILAAYMKKRGKGANQSEDFE